MLKKIIWANFQRIIELFTQSIVTKLSKIWVWDPRSGIRKKTYSGSRIQGSKRPPIPNTEFVKIYFLCSGPADERPERPEQQRCETVPTAAAAAATHQRSDRRQQDQY
jgi:hypothetical protein